MMGTKQLKIAAVLSFIASALHIAVIFGGPDWYRFFGAGEDMAQLAAAGSSYPTTITLLIALVLALWGLYALSGAGVIGKLPLLKLGLVIITGIYLVRGIAGLILPFILNHPAVAENSIEFWLISSAVCCVLGVFYLLGTKNSWEYLSSRNL